MFRRIPALLLILAAALPLAAAAKSHSVKIKEWPVPWPDSQPRSPFAVSDTEVWFVGEAGNYLATLDPQTGRFSKIDLVDEPAPHDLIVGANRMVWFTGTAHAYIGRYDPVTRRIWRFPMPSAAAGDPTSLIFEAGERNIWFTVPEGNIIGRLRVDSGVVDLVGLTTPKALPAGIAVAPDAGPPWVALFGTNKLATVDPGAFRLTEHTLPRDDARPRRVAFTRDGRLWYVDFANGYLGALTPATGDVKEWPFPDGRESQPYAMAVDSADRIWVVETGVKPNRLVSFDPKTERFGKGTPIPSGGGAVSDMRYDAARGELWFCTDANTIGYAKLN